MQNIGIPGRGFHQFLGVLVILHRCDDILGMGRRSQARVETPKKIGLS